VIVPARKAGKRVVAAEAWKAVLGFIVATADRRSEALRRLGLTPNEARALSSLEPARGRAMGSLADQWHCDASTATWIVNRLARRGLVARRPSPDDRRITLVALTGLGASVKRRWLRAAFTPPPELLELAMDELVALRSAAEALDGARRRDRGRR
jgi:DNA-binding MarR family transcriptional regulator